ncbi:MAG: cytochrome b [Phenylobacterium sp.]|uniref:cytochrome b n=1 Tax=Phenylobacterium sp. TaxID=1871053 RepID=UPI0025CDD460|nr:cytochrome b [Phenylobacterium sp.]MCA6225480.1 cytochrome b [Phenylobacterium sp.]MCA6233221.1 cytochrome b [Phenylobacterium sp.]MCA6235912.1 cytochrome b [Phenylobacterium sp.]MCA6248590.1 cytochrome b [Phenylobacterium sp.]MCA6251746.1 cytochrome b [Phenylobacterium sp.]
MSADTSERLSRISIFLHWTTAGLVIATLVAGAPLDDMPDGASRWEAIAFHISLGLTVLAWGLARGLWRLSNGMPIPLKAYNAATRLVSKVVRYGMLLLSVALPVSGIFMAVEKGYGLSYFGFEIIRSAETKIATVTNLQTVHQIGAWTMVAFIGIHVAASLKALLVDRDGSFPRMLGVTVRSIKPSDARR